jgi:hypothetical protein
MTPEDIEALLHREGGVGDGGALDDDEASAMEGVEDSERLRRTQLLGEVLTTARDLWFAGDEAIDLVAQKLGDGSRDCE